MLAIDPKGFTLVESLNVFSDTNVAVNSSLAARQHRKLCETLQQKKQKGGVDLDKRSNETLTVGSAPSNENLPDLVFVANAGLLLRGLPEKVVLLSNMKYPSRKKETKHVRRILSSLRIKSVAFPSTEPFEGQGECQWFLEDKLLILGYGFRSTAKTVLSLQTTLNRIYGHYKIDPPFVFGVKLANPESYHLDIAMCPVSEDECIVHEGALTDVTLLRRLLRVRVLRSKDPFALNLIPMRDKVVAHKLQFKKDKLFLENAFQLPVVEVDVGEFEKSGGSIRCMVLSI